MFTELHWIDGPWPGRLAVSARPRGGEWLADEMKGWRASGLDTVVSLLTPDEVDDLGLQEETQFCQDNALRFVSFPITDRSVPTSHSEAVRLIEQIDSDLSRGQKVVIHCRQGLGRSGLIAASLLAHRGVPPTEAMELVSIARHAPVPETADQRAWITEFGATMQAAGQQLSRR